MKTLKLAAVVVGICALVSFGCEGKQGPAGPAGTAGATGAPGTQGTQGPQGPAGNLTAVPVTGSVILSLGGADLRYANPGLGSLYSYTIAGELHRLGDTGYSETNALAVSSTTKTLYVGQGIKMGGGILKIDLATGSVTRLGKIGVKDGVLGMTFSQDGSLLAVGANCCGPSSPALITVNTSTGAGTVRLPLTGGLVYGIGFSPNGTLVGFDWGTLRSINMSTGAITAVPGPQSCGGAARGLAVRTATEIVGGSGSNSSSPVVYRLNLTTGVCTASTLATLGAGSGSSGMGVAIAP